MRNEVNNINVDKALDRIGLNNQIVYDRIETFIDIHNKNNVWAKVFYIDYKKTPPEHNHDFLFFSSNNEMMHFIRNNFNCDELNHYVSYLERKIFFHNIDYLNLEAYLHENRPELNYIELNYKEYINNDCYIKKIQLPYEIKERILNALCINMKIDKDTKLNSEIYKTNEVIVPRKKRYNPNKLPEKSPKPRISKLVIAVSAAALVALFTEGYVLVTEYNKKHDIVTQNKNTNTVRDFRIWHDEEKVGVIVDALMNNNYENITLDDLKNAISYIQNVEYSNYDFNTSTTTFNYSDYFAFKLFESNQKVIIGEEGILSKIDTLYKKCFVPMNDMVFLNQDAVNKYIDYVASLTFMYDTLVDTRGSNQIPMDTQSLISHYAVKKEIEEYNAYPPILRYIILNQLKQILSNSTDYHVTVRPSNYYGGLEKEDLIAKVVDKMGTTYEEMRSKCQNSTKTK